MQATMTLGKGEGGFQTRPYGGEAGGVVKHAPAGWEMAV